MGRHDTHLVVFVTSDLIGFEGHETTIHQESLSFPRNSQLKHDDEIHLRVSDAAHVCGDRSRREKSRPEECLHE